MMPASGGGIRYKLLYEVSMFLVPYTIEPALVVDILFIELELKI